MQQDMICKLPDQILRLKAQQVTSFDSELKDLISQMFVIMKQKHGVGLAAPQIGISKRVFVYGFDTSPRYPGVSGVPMDYAVNPEIIWQSTDMTEFEEGCLSVPNTRGLVVRAKSLTYTYQDIHGATLQKTVHDFAARIVAHEIDHLNGILYIDRAQAVHNSKLS